MEVLFVKTTRFDSYAEGANGSSVFMLELSSLTECSTEEGSVLEDGTEEYILDSSVTFSGKKLAGPGGILAGKGTWIQNIAALL
ncbi:UNVERIFIED_CONTAM: hypothetical protein Sradi_5995500 [Sesamum radiatum]|uniref:Uncharacterized protein n=1 Tax=Sesamum radiatum TaxID=300843 RepID=A0AAW2KHS1_SESRA